MTFRGFDPRSLQLLESLPALSAAEYEKLKPNLTAGLVEPAGAFIEEVAASLDEPLTVVPRSSVSPLHADLRFAKPGAPRYKDHLLLTAWQGPDKKASPILWIRLDSVSVGFASGAALLGNQREQFRASVAGARGKALDAALATLRRKHARHALEVAGEQLKKVPRPWSDDHERAELLRLTSFQVRFREAAPRSIAQPGFVAWCAERLEQLMPVHRWLVRELLVGDGR
jgi:Conserved hypothetical protein (DUF2461)